MQSTEDGRSEVNCWKRMGVWGREPQRCPRLAEVMHCRNCDVYTRAGRRLLERDLPEGYTSEWADVMAAQKEDDPTGAATVVIFRIAGEWLALPAGVLAEVIDPGPPHSIPGRQSPVLMGLINVHGEIHLCVSLLDLLGLVPRSAGEAGEGDQNNYRRMVVLDKEGDRWVFPVDEIHGVNRISHDAFQNVPATVSKGDSTLTKGIFEWKERSVALLDDDLLLSRLIRSVQ